MASAAADIADYLENLSPPEFENIYVNNSPSEPDNTIELNDTGGVPHTDAMGDQAKKPFLQNPGLQVKVRNNSSRLASETVHKISNVLHGLNTTINGTRYYYIWAVQNPFFLFKDERERFYYVCNFLMKRDFVV
jgi:hypothetical protein